MSKKIFYITILLLSVYFIPFPIYEKESEVSPRLRIDSNKIFIIENTEEFYKNLAHRTINYGNSRMKSVVFGYLPEWMLNTARNYLKYNLVTHISIFPFNVKSDGSLSYPKEWPWNDVIENAQLSDVKIILTAFSNDTDDIHNFLTNQELKLKFFQILRETLEKYKLDGVNIDFESLKAEDKGERINAFMKELTQYMHFHIPGSEVSIAGPAVNWDGLWDLTGLANSCDYIFVMSYCYFGSWSKYSGPAATLTGREYSIDSTFTSRKKGYGTVVEKFPESLVMGVPYYRNYWITETSDPHSQVTRFLGNLSYDESMAIKSNYLRIWHEDYNVPWYLAQINGEWHQLWLDGPVSLELKFDYAISKKLRGIGIWALGFDKDRKELWNLIDDKFSNRISTIIVKGINPSVKNELTTVDTLAEAVTVKTDETEEIISEYYDEEISSN